MPKKIKLEAHLSSEELESRYRGAKDPVERSHFQIIWLINEGKTTTQVMKVTGYSRGWIQQLARLTTPMALRLWATAGTKTRAPNRGPCSTQTNKESSQRNSRSLPLTEGCGTRAR